MKYEHLSYNKNLKSNAKQLRKNMTKQERHLWYDFLRNYPVKIYRQKMILNYIVDFYCSSAKLAIEIDGSQHYDDSGIKYDTVRAQKLSSHGTKIIRFSNHDIDTNFEGVCITIHNEIQNLIKENK
jgi:very-short-patch-repair endonuclease